MTCPTCKGSVRAETVRASSDGGTTWITKTYARCISNRLRNRCPVLVTTEGHEPTSVTPGPVTLPKRRKTRQEELKGQESP